MRRFTPGASTAVLPPSRRELIASFLGAAALAGCRKGPGAVRLPLEVEGTLADDLHELGHRLRQPAEPAASGPARQVDVAVVGAGVSGLSAGWRLAGAGLTSFVVLEVDGAVGGTAKGGASPVTPFPWGAHYVPAPLSSRGPVPRLLGELGVLLGEDDAGRPRFAEEALVQEPEERLFFQGRWYEGLYPRAGARAEDVAQLERFEATTRALAAARDGRGRKAFAVPLETGSDDAEWTALDRRSAAEWLAAEGYDSPRLRWLVDYACRDDFGAGLAETSAWAMLWYFSARQTGDARNEGYLTWPEGNAHLAGHLARAIGSERIQLGTLVHRVDRIASRWRLSGRDARTGAPVAVDARHVILATPRFVASRLVTAWRDSPPAFVREFAYSPWVVANLHLSARPGGRGAPLAWDNVLYDSASLGYVEATHQRLRAEESGPTVLTWYYPLSRASPEVERQRLLETSWADWNTIALADLLPAHRDLPGLLRRIDVMRWGHAMIRPRPGFIWGPARRQAKASLEGSLHFAHTDLSGLAMFEEANWHGVRAAEAALAGLGKPGDSWLEA